MKEKDSNVALYRKYRPNNWGEVVGQDHIVKAISGALKQGKISHSYLLYGPRGTGKTSIARIIAQEIGTSSNDVYELDAASNRGIDDVRNIREGVRTLPFDSKYKVYILDEVHMFTKEAWNALLKTIEEPPEHVVFILATTEIEKVPETIISRCQTFTFKKPTESILKSVIDNVADKEGYKLEDGGSSLIAMLADGAFRDALGILQKVISFSKDKKISQKEIEDVTGAPDGILVNKFINSLSNENLEDGFIAIKETTSKNISMDIYMKMIISKIRYILMIRYAPQTAKEIFLNIGDKDFDYIKSVADKKPKYITSKSLDILLNALSSEKDAFIKELPLEMALIEIFGEENIN